MNHNEENNFKEYLKDTTPNLWAKIDSKLPSGMYTKDSSNNTLDNNISNQTLNNKSVSEQNNDTKDSSDTLSDAELDEPSSNKVVKFKPRRIYKVAAILAACMIFAVLAMYEYSGNGPSNFTSRSELAKDSTNDYVSNIKGDHDNKDNSLSEDSSNIDNSTNSNTYDSIVENEIDSNENTEPETNNDSTNNATKDSVEDKASPSATIAPKENASADTIIKVNVLYLHSENEDIGLIYKGIVIDTNSSTINKQQTVYVSLRNLSRHDLRHTYKIGETFTISINDDSYTSTLKKP